MRIITTLLFLLSFQLFCFSQDTLVVQAFDYNSGTRDSVISFPTGDHNQYEKIIMHYNMRCKDGLVSTTSDRNKGCGEWDYSCNTSIIDSTLIDSTLAFHPNYIIFGHPDPFFEYVEYPTYTYHLRDLDHVTINNESNYVRHILYNEQEQTDALFSDQKVQKLFYLIDNELFNNTVTNKINGISFQQITNAEDLKFVKIKMATTPADSIDANLIENAAFETVYNDHVDENVLSSGIYFTRDFNYEDSDNILLELSYTNTEKTLTTTTPGKIADDRTMIYHEGSDRYVNFSNTMLDIPVDNLQDIKDEISIAVWIKGNETSLPKNTTFLLAHDESNQRQLNIHLPWGNGQVYWDCGGNGNNYDRINMPADASSYRKDWNHWAFTKDAHSGVMSIYLNGELWLTQGGKTNPIDIKKMRIGADFENRNIYEGGVDDLMIFDKALSAADIQHLSKFRPDENDAYYSNLKLFLDFNEESDTSVKDQSPAQVEATFANSWNQITFRGDEIFKDFSFAAVTPTISLIESDVNRMVSTQTITDSIQNFPFEIQPFRVEGTDLIMDPSFAYWQAGYTFVYDQEGNKIDSVEILFDDVIYINQLEYYRKTPAKFELLSFVTPYGINLDFGLGGRTWLFDVTDFGPILKGKKRLVMDRGGQWQEEMDIRFLFIKGTPSRNVLKIHQIWPVQSISNAAILENDRFEKRNIPIEDDVASAKLRVAVTGHGQEGEFIPRTHFIKINGGQKEYSWQVWKECAYNPVYPQGGTWVYDRAGWCPGAPTDLIEHEIMEYIHGDDDFDIDYGMNVATGDSRYIINGQVVKYGPRNFKLDASIEEIISPTNYVEYDRINPSCAKPTIRIQNNGSQTIRSLWIAYGVVGTETISHQWKGNLESGESEIVELPSFSEGRWSRGNEFQVTVKLPNDQADEYENNNSMTSQFEQTPHIDGYVIVNLITNGAPNETKWYLRDEDNNIVASRTSGFSAFENYLDTIRNLDGCYQLQFVDSGQDGISWWANNDGNGFVRVRAEGEFWTTLEPDFGAEITYAFTAGMTTSTQEWEKLESEINVFPNPSYGIYHVELTGLHQAYIEVYNGTGQQLQSHQHLCNPKYDEFIVDLTNEPDGIYFISIVNSKGEKRVEKVIKGN
jgi:hypothetical protein